MKTSITTVLKSSLLATVLMASMFMSNASAETIIACRGGAADNEIKKVVATGNVKVTLIQNASEWVQMDELDSSKVSLKQVGNTLTISSSESTPVAVTVYVKDIYRIAASDKATVRTAGKFNVKYLQVMLKDDAAARVKASTESIYTVIDGKAKLELLGTSGKHITKTSGLAQMDTDKFAALKTVNENDLTRVTASLVK